MKMSSKKSACIILSAVLMSTSANIPISSGCKCEDKFKNSKNMSEMCLQNSDAVAVEKMLKKGFRFDKDPFQCSSIKEIKFDLFQYSNLDLSLKESLNFILNDETTSFIDNKHSLNSCILQNQFLCENIKNTEKYIDSREFEFKKNLELLKRLSFIKAIMESDSRIPKSNAFFRLISSLRDAYATKVSRKIAEKILNDYREEVESKMEVEDSSRGVGVSSTAQTGAINLGISVGLDNSEGASEKSFYKIDNSGNIRLSIGAGFKKFLSADASYNLKITHTLIFYSLEQFLDTCAKDGKITSIELRDEYISKIISSREEMQKNEKLILSSMQTSVEWFLKASQIVPQNVNFKWPEVTQTKPANVQKAVTNKADISGAASCLASVGANVSVDSKTTDTLTKHTYLSLIQNDCSVSSYVENSNQLVSFLKQENTKKYSEIKSYFEKYLKDKEIYGNNYAPQTLSVLVSNIIGDLRMYNSVLSVLADEHSLDFQIENCKKSKHEIEKEWLGNFEKSRKNMLKTAISLAAYLRNFANTNEEINLFKQLHTELEHLSEMQIFDKSSSVKNMYFNTNHKANIKSVSGKFYFAIPLLGTSFIEASYINSNGEAYFDNSENIEIKMQIPMFGDSILGEHSIRNKLKDLMLKFSGEKSNESEAFKNTLGIIENNFDDILANLGIKMLVSIPTVFSTGQYMTLDYLFEKSEKNVPLNENILPLPGCIKPILKERDNWVLKLIKRIDSTISELNIGIKEYANSNISHCIGKKDSIIGSDSLKFILNKYNTFQLGSENSLCTQNHLWDRFRESQIEQFKNLFLNMNYESKNVKYELQCIWNTVNSNVQSDAKMPMDEKIKVLNYCETQFKEFLHDCDALNKDSSIENLKKAFKSFDEILKINYEYNFYPEVKRINTVKKI